MKGRYEIFAALPDAASDSFKRLRVDDSAVPADRPGALQVAQPPVARGHAERDPLRELGDGEPTLHLELGKDLPVNRVHYEDYCAIRTLAA